MKEKKKCEKCGLLIDDDSTTCPYCGYAQTPVAEEKSTDKQEQQSYDIHDLDAMLGNNKEHKESLIKEKTVQEKKKFNLTKFESRSIALSVPKQVFFFLMGSLGLTLVSLLIQLIIKAVNPYFLIQSSTSGTLNFILYSFLFGLMILVIFNDITTVVKDFKIGKTWGNGIGYGAALIIISYLVNVIISIISTLAGTNVTTNNNEATIESIASIYPIASIVIFGVIGPICEEITYRLGLFSLLKRLNKVVAYVFTALIFGAIHFDWTCLGSGNAPLIINEFLNLPSYIVAGVILCYTYDRLGISGSIIAHCTNNLYAMLMTIIASNIATKCF